MTDAAPTFFKLQQVAEQLQLPYGLVRDRVHSGAWPHVKFSERNRRMTQEQIDRVVEMNRHEPQPSSLSSAHDRRRRFRGYLNAV